MASGQYSIPVAEGAFSPPSTEVQETMHLLEAFPLVIDSLKVGAAVADGETGGQVVQVNKQSIEDIMSRLDARLVLGEKGELVGASVSKPWAEAESNSGAGRRVTVWIILGDSELGRMLKTGANVAINFNNSTGCTACANSTRTIYANLAPMYAARSTRIAYLFGDAAYSRANGQRTAAAVGALFVNSMAQAVDHILNEDPHLAVEGDKIFAGALGDAIEGTTMYQHIHVELVKITTARSTEASDLMRQRFSLTPDQAAAALKTVFEFAIRISDDMMGIPLVAAAASLIMDKRVVAIPGLDTYWGGLQLEHDDTAEEGMMVVDNPGAGLCKMKNIFFDTAYSTDYAQIRRGMAVMQYARALANPGKDGDTAGEITKQVLSMAQAQAMGSSSSHIRRIGQHEKVTAEQIIDFTEAAAAHACVAIRTKQLGPRLVRLTIDGEVDGEKGKLKIRKASTMISVSGEILSKGTATSDEIRRAAQGFQKDNYAGDVATLIPMAARQNLDRLGVKAQICAAVPGIVMESAGPRMLTVDISRPSKHSTAAGLQARQAKYEQFLTAIESGPSVETTGGAEGRRAGHSSGAITTLSHEMVQVAATEIEKKGLANALTSMGAAVQDPQVKALVTLIGSAVDKEKKRTEGEFVKLRQAHQQQIDKMLKEHRSQTDRLAKQMAANNEATKAALEAARSAEQRASDFERRMEERFAALAGTVPASTTASTTPTAAAAQSLPMQMDDTAWPKIPDSPRKAAKPESKPQSSLTVLQQGLHKRPFQPRSGTLSFAGGGCGSAGKAVAATEAVATAVISPDKPSGTEGVSG